MDYAHSEGQAALGRDPREYLVQTKSFRASSKERLRLRLGGAGRCRTVPDEEVRRSLLARTGRRSRMGRRRGGVSKGEAFRRKWRRIT